MKRISVILGTSYLAFLMEFFFYNTFGAWGKPELLILTIVFFNLYLGVRYGIMAAFFCGLLKDITAPVPLGMYTMVYLLGAYGTVLTRKYLYQPGSRFSRIMVAFFAVLTCFIVQSIIVGGTQDLRWDELITYLLVPQLVATMVVATFVFYLLKNISEFLVLKNQI